MSIVGTLRIFSEKCVSSPDPGDMVSTEDSSAVFRMLSALGSVEPAFVARAGSALFGTSADGSVAQDPASGILVCANGVPHDSSACHRGTRPAGASAVLAAYQQWGESFPLHLCGDFSCALWDQPRGRLVLARDHLGNAGLFFRRSDESIVFGSDPREILADPRIPREIDEEHMAFFLSMLPVEDTSTYFRSIERVLPGHLVVFEGGEGRRHRWWRPEEIGTLRLGSHKEYADALRCSLDQAVGCRLPCTGNTGVALSSGLDSTGIAALAARRLAKEGRRLIAGTQVFSADAAQFQGSRWFADEFPLASKLAEAWPNIDHHRVVPDDSPWLKGVEALCAISGTPSRTAGANSVLSLIDFAASQHVSLWLTGGAGNFISSYDGMLLGASLLRRGRVGQLAALFRQLRRNGIPWPTILRKTFSPWIPPAIHRGLRRIAGRVSGDLFESSPILPQLAQSTGILNRVRSSGVGLDAVSRGNSRIHRMTGYHRFDHGYAREGLLRRFGFIAASPAADRRVVELCLSIPEEQFVWGGQPRALIRTALRGIVPEAILNAPKRGRQGLGWERRFQVDFPAIRREIGLIAKSPTAVRCLDVPRLQRLADRWEAAPPAPGTHDNEFRAVLAFGVSVGVFLRRFEAGGQETTA